MRAKFLDIYLISLMLHLSVKTVHTSLENGGGRGNSGQGIKSISLLIVYTFVGPG